MGERWRLRRFRRPLSGSCATALVLASPGAVVGQQPFGGARGSGTNDKAGSILNLVRWISPRTIKETFAPARAFEYPFMSEK